MKHILLSVLLGWPLWAQATPDPGVQMRDQIISAGPGSYVVIRSETFYPATYYQYTRRLSVLRISPWTNSVQTGCVLQETRWATDAVKDDGVWFVAQQMDPTCADGVLDLGADQSAIRPFADTAPRDMSIKDLLPASYVTDRFGAVTGDWYDHIAQYDVPHVQDDCAFTGAVWRADGVDWHFATFECDDGGQNRLSVHIPISEKTWRKGQ